MKKIACLYFNNEYIYDGTTKYFLSIYQCNRPHNRFLKLVLRLSLCHETFIYETSGALEIENTSYSTCKNDKHIGTFWDKDGVVIYEHT